MSCRTRMTMRAYAQRNSATRDAGGHLNVPVWGTLATIPCYAWVRLANAFHKAELSADETRYRAIIPKSTDLTTDDRIETIKDRAGAELFPTLYIDAVLQRRDHLELRLRDHEGVCSGTVTR